MENKQVRQQCGITVIVQFVTTRKITCNNWLNRAEEEEFVLKYADTTTASEPQKRWAISLENITKLSTI